MEKPLILVVDDEADLVWAIQRYLRDAGYEVLTAQNGLEALSVAQRHNPSLVILDIGLPYLNGFEVCDRMRKDLTLHSTPIIFLTKRSTDTDQVTGLNKGADNYLVKPIDLKILKAHIQAMLRRTYPELASDNTSEGAPSTLAAGAITLDVQSRFARIGDRVSELTPLEFDLLRFFMSHPGEVFTSYQILDLVWATPQETANPCLVRWHIMNLRKKIESVPAYPEYILTMSRHGYMLKV